MVGEGLAPPVNPAQPPLSAQTPFPHGRGGACSSRVQNIEFAQKHFNEYINSYKYADLIFMYSREEHTVCEAHSALPYRKH